MALHHVDCGTIWTTLTFLHPWLPPTCCPLQSEKPCSLIKRFLFQWYLGLDHCPLPSKGNFKPKIRYWLGATSAIDMYAWGSILWMGFSQMVQLSSFVASLCLSSSAKDDYWCRLWGFVGARLKIIDCKFFWRKIENISYMSGFNILLSDDKKVEAIWYVECWCN